MPVLVFLLITFPTQLAESAGSTDTAGLLNQLSPVIIRLLIALVACLVGLVAALGAFILLKPFGRRIAVTAAGGAFVGAGTFSWTLLDFVLFG